MNEADLSSADKAIINALADNGNLTKGALVDETEYSRNTVYTRLEVLQAGEVVECIHEPTRLFTLADDLGQDVDASPFAKARHAFNHLDPAEVEAFVAVIAANSGVDIHLNATSGTDGITRHLTLMAAYLRALASVVDTSIEDIAEACLKRAKDIHFDGDSDHPDGGSEGEGTG